MNARLLTMNAPPLTDAYRVARHPAPVSLRLDGNEGQVVSEEVLDVLSELPLDELRQYPSCAALEARIAREYGVTPDQVLVTAGADDGLLRMCRGYLSPSRDLLLPVPTFEMIQRFASWCFASVRTVPWMSGGYPLDAVLDAVDGRTGIIAVVSPNNPTGGVITADALRRLSTSAPNSMLMVDCAYAEFADDDLTDVALALPNAVVFRTLSKALGLAGLRVGFAMGPASAIKTLRAVGMPYPVSAPSLRLASAALDRRAESAPYISAVRQERVRLLSILEEQGIEALPSQGNFVFARTGRALWWRDAFAGLGIGVRAWPETPGMDNALRLTCPGDPDDFQRLERAIRTIECPEAILFDIDGVLADVSASYRATIMATAAEFGVTVSLDDIESVKRAGDANNDWVVTQRLLAQGGVEMPLETVKDVFEARYWGTSDVPGLYLQESFIGCADRLKQLAARYPLAAVTGRPRRDAMSVLERFGILGCFSAVVTMDDGPAKPDAFPVEEALRRLGVERAWMLGDTRDDAEAARAAGVLPLGVLLPGEGNPGAARQHLLESGAARVFTDWMELEVYLP